MPQATSKKQFRLMMAIANGKAGKTARGDHGPPKSVAAKYTAPDKDAPESKNKEHSGGRWDGEKKKKDKEKEEDKKDKKEKKDMDKAEKEPVKKPSDSDEYIRDQQYLKPKKTLDNPFAAITPPKGHPDRSHPSKIKIPSVKKSEFDISEIPVSVYKSKGVGLIIVDDSGQILVGKDDKGNYTFPGGHVEANESFEDAAIRELKEESHLTIDKDKLKLIGSLNLPHHDSKVFLVKEEDCEGSLKNSDEVKDWRFITLENLSKLAELRSCCKAALDLYLESGEANLKKTSLLYIVAKDNLAKNILRGANGKDAVFEVSHGEALRLVGNGAFKFLHSAVKDMQDEDFKEVHIDTYTIHIRKHTNDMYSGRIVDGHKVVHQFTNKSLPALTAEVMSVFEWYMPEDEQKLLAVNPEDIDEAVVSGGLNGMINEYKRHNLANIYEEMDNMRQEIRNGAAIDIQQVEIRLMKLFDKLEEHMRTISDKHNILVRDAGTEIEALEIKMRELQEKIESMAKKPSTVEAFSAAPANPAAVHSESYMYLTKPQVIIEPTGRIRITFSEDWNNFDKENFLRDMKAKALKKSKK